MSEETVLVGKKSRRIVGVAEPVEQFPTLDSIHVHVSNNSTLNELFPTEKLFLGYLELVMKDSKNAAINVFIAIAQELFDGTMDFDSDTEQEMWDALSSEGFAETLYINFKELADQFRKEITKK